MHTTMQKKKSALKSRNLKQALKTVRNHKNNAWFLEDYYSKKTMRWSIILWAEFCFIIDVLTLKMEKKTRKEIITTHYITIVKKEKSLKMRNINEFRLAGNFKKPAI